MGNPPPARIPCPIPGCGKEALPSELESHLRDHEVASLRRTPSALPSAQSNQVVFAPEIDDRTGLVLNLPGGFRESHYYPPPSDRTVAADCVVPGCTAQVMPKMATRHKLDHLWRYLALPDLSERDMEYLVRLVDQGRVEMIAERVQLEGKRLKPPRDLEIKDQDLPCAACGEIIRAGNPLENVRPLGRKRNVVVHPHCRTPRS